MNSEIMVDFIGSTILLKNMLIGDQIMTLDHK
jgi:hypothetical protein